MIWASKWDTATSVICRFGSELTEHIKVLRLKRLDDRRFVFRKGNFLSRLARKNSCFLDLGYRSKSSFRFSTKGKLLMWKVLCSFPSSRLFWTKSFLHCVECSVYVFLRMSWMLRVFIADYDVKLKLSFFFFLQVFFFRNSQVQPTTT